MENPNRQLEICRQTLTLLSVVRSACRPWFPPVNPKNKISTACSLRLANPAVGWMGLVMDAMGAVARSAALAKQLDSSWGNSAVAWCLSSLIQCRQDLVSYLFGIKSGLCPSYASLGQCKNDTSYGFPIRLRCNRNNDAALQSGGNGPDYDAVSKPSIRHNS
jgi:hypothetical protein